MTKTQLTTVSRFVWGPLAMVNKRICRSFLYCTIHVMPTTFPIAVVLWTAIKASCKFLLDRRLVVTAYRATHAFLVVINLSYTTKELVVVSRVALALWAAVTLFGRTSSIAINHFLLLAPRTFEASSRCVVIWWCLNTSKDRWHTSAIFGPSVMVSASNILTISFRTFAQVHKSWSVFIWTWICTFSRSVFEVNAKRMVFVVRNIL